MWDHALGDKKQEFRNLSVRNDCEKSFSVFANQKVTEPLRWCSRRRTQWDHSMHHPEIQKFWALLHGPSRDLIWKCSTHSQLCVCNKDGLKALHIHRFREELSGLSEEEKLVFEKVQEEHGLFSPSWERVWSLSRNRKEEKEIFPVKGNAGAKPNEQEVERRLLSNEPQRFSKPGSTGAVVEKAFKPKLHQVMNMLCNSV